MNTRSKTCRRTKSGPCARLTGHKGTCRPTLTKSAGRPSLAVEVRTADHYVVLPDAPAEGRDVQFIGRAKRAKAAPLGTKSRSNANALKGRMRATKAGTSK